jgi:hypothetical protein
MLKYPLCMTHVQPGCGMLRVVPKMAAYGSWAVVWILDRHGCLNRFTVNQPDCGRQDGAEAGANDLRQCYVLADISLEPSPVKGNSPAETGLAPLSLSVQQTTGL